MKYIRILLLFIIFCLLTSPVSAASLNEAMIRPSRMTANFTADATNPVLVVFEPVDTGGTNTETNIRITLASDYTIPTGTVNTTVTGIPSTIQGEALVALPGITATSTSNNTTKIIDVTCTNLTGSTQYGFFITSGVQNPSSTETGYVSTIATQLTAGGTTVDSARVATYNLTGSDQVTINAQVPPLFTMELSTNTLTFASDLTTTVQSSPTMTVTLTTNARNGWATWIKSLNAGLKSGLTTITTDNDNPNTCLGKDSGESFYQFNVSGKTLGVNGTRTAITNLTKFDACAADTGGSFIAANTWQEFSRNDGTTSGDILTIHALAAIGGWEPAAVDYTDTWTIIGAANF